MATIVDAIVLIIIFVCIIAIPITAIYFEYKKKIAMIERGIIPEEEKEKQDRSPGNKLAWGIAMFGIGTSLLISWKFNFGEEFIAGLIFISIGIGLLVAYFWNRTKINE